MLGKDEPDARRRPGNVCLPQYGLGPGSRNARPQVRGHGCGASLAAGRPAGHITVSRRHPAAVLSMPTALVLMTMPGIVRLLLLGPLRRGDVTGKPVMTVLICISSPGFIFPTMCGPR